MNRGAHERALDDATRLELVGQRIAPEVSHATPEADVSRRRVLVLDAPDPFECLRDGNGSPIEQELAGEQCPVEHPNRQDRRRH